MNQRLFISHRRSEQREAAGTLAEALEAALGSESVFFDFSTVRLGDQSL